MRVQKIVSDFHCAVTWMGNRLKKHLLRDALVSFSFFLCNTLGRSKKSGETRLQWDASASDHVNLLHDNINTTMKPKDEDSVRGYEDIGLETNAEKTKYMFMFRP
jgi:hypothetical protein